MASLDRVFLGHPSLQKQSTWRICENLANNAKYTGESLWRCPSQQSTWTICENLAILNWPLLEMCLPGQCAVDIYDSVDPMPVQNICTHVYEYFNLVMNIYFREGVHKSWKFMVRLTVRVDPLPPFPDWAARANLYGKPEYLQAALVCTRCV